MKLRILSIGILALALSSCSGSSSSGVTMNNTASADNPGCESNYHRTMIGKYSGVIQVSVPDGTFNPPVNCEWVIDIEILGFGPSEDFCGLSMRTTTIELNQLTVFPADDENVYQCIESNGIHTLSHPFANESNIAVLNNVEFPVTIGVAQQNITDEGGYFDDNTLVVPWYQLFAGNRGKLMENDRLAIFADGRLEIPHESFDSITLSVLNKE